MDRTLDRRTALQLGGAATVAAVAGCSDLLGGGSSSGSVQYAQYLPVQDNQVFFAYADFEALEELDTGTQNDGGSGGTDGELGFDDPMLAPAGGLFLIAFSAGFQLASLGLGGLIQMDEESDLDSAGNQILLANETTVIVGEIDTDEIDEQLTSSSDENPLVSQYEQVAESGGYTFYEPAGDSESAGSQDSVVAVSESELLTASSREAVDSVVNATNGDGRATEEFDEFQWLLNNAGGGLIALGGYGPEGFDGPGDDSGGSGGDSESEFDFVQNSGGFVGSISLDGSDAKSVLAASSEEISEEQQSQIESELQSDRTDVSVDFQSDGRLIAEATYGRNVLENGGDSSDA